LRDSHVQEEHSGEVVAIVLLGVEHCTLLSSVVVPP